jgi:hypothetical protein
VRSEGVSESNKTGRQQQEDALEGRQRLLDLPTLFVFDDSTNDFAVGHHCCPVFPAGLILYIGKSEIRKSRKTLKKIREFY